MVYALYDSLTTPGLQPVYALEYSLVYALVYRLVYAMV